MDQSYSKIPGWGSDADLSARPGVPRRKPGSVPATHAGEPAWQEGAAREIHPPDSLVTPVFGTSTPLKRTMPSGWVRRLAYRIPQDRSGHWLLLVAGDRLDVLETRLRPVAGLALAVAGAAFLAGVVRGVRESG